MTTTEKTDWRVEYSDVLREGSTMAAHVYCWDSLASIIAELRHISPDMRTSDWIMDSLHDRTHFLIESVPGLKGSPSADTTKMLVDAIGRSIAAYESLSHEEDGPSGQTNIV